MNRPGSALLSVALALLGASSDPESLAAREDAYKANNVGIGMLEQYRYDDAVAAFRTALAADPDLAIARTNLAIALLYVPDLDGARREAEAAAALAPSAPQPQYVLGLVAKGQNRPDEALAAFVESPGLRPAPTSAPTSTSGRCTCPEALPRGCGRAPCRRRERSLQRTALYNLGIASTRAGQAEEGQKALERFEALRKSGTGIVFSQSYPEQGRYAEAAVSTGAEPSLVDAAVPGVHFVDATAKALPGESARATRATVAGRAALLDVGGDGVLDLLEVSAAGERLMRNASGVFTAAAKNQGLDPATGGLGAVVGDVDGDGRPDLLVLREKGVTLYHADAQKGFVDVTAAAGLAGAPRAVTAALVDVDHDGDLDIVLAGAATRLFRNDGKGVFADVTDAAGLGGPHPDVRAIVATDFDNRRDVDLVFLNAEGPPSLFKNLRDGSFRDVAVELGLSKAEGHFLSIAAGDVNKDGYTDFLLGARGRGPRWRSRTASAASGVVPWARRPAIAALRSWTTTTTGCSTSCRRRRGACSSSATWAAGVERRDRRGPAEGVRGREPRCGGPRRRRRHRSALRSPSGRCGSSATTPAAKNRSLRIRLAGRVSNRSGVGAKIELRAGSLRQKLETYAATPPAAPADVVFGLGARAARRRGAGDLALGHRADRDGASRGGPGGAHGACRSTELDRKPSSCPYLYAWNGERFEFVTDFLGGGEMGYWLGPGVLQHARSRRVRAPRAATSSRPRDGRFELRVTNELEEALFLDQLRLLAVDHPSDVEVYPERGHDRRRRGPFRLFAVRDLRTPRAPSTTTAATVTDARRAARPRRSSRASPCEPIRGYARDACARRSISSDVPARPHPAPAHRLDRLRVLERQRGRRASAASSLEPPAPRGARTRTAPGQHGDRTTWAFPSAGRRRSSSTSRAWPRPEPAACGSSRTCASTGTRSGRRPRPTSPLTTGRSTPVARGPPRARVLGRGDARRPRALRLRLRARRPGLALEDVARPLHAARATSASCSRAADDLFVVSRPGDEVALSFDATAARRAAGRAGRARSCSTATASARRWTSTPRARTSPARCRSTA